MKKRYLRLFVYLLFFVGFTSFQPVNSNKSISERINFKIKGTKKVFVTIGIGSRPGMGACCTGVSVNSTVSFSGFIGDVVYDGKTRKVISKIYKEMEGTTIDLNDYY